MMLVRGRPEGWKNARWRLNPDGVWSSSAWAGTDPDSLYLVDTP